MPHATTESRDDPHMYTVIYMRANGFVAGVTAHTFSHISNLHELLEDEERNHFISEAVSSVEFLVRAQYDSRNMRIEDLDVESPFILEDCRLLI
ncbi:hypothetical protein GGH91_005481, partial [Coemansia sp. RSA 2671]